MLKAVISIVAKLSILDVFGGPGYASESLHKNEVFY